MNKSELAVKLAREVHLTNAKAAEVVDSIFNARSGIIAVELSAGRKVSLPGFGTFSTRKRAARLGRNPATGSAIKIRSTHYAAFSAGRTLKEALGGAWFSPVLGEPGPVRRGTKLYCPVDPDGCPAKYRRTAGQIIACQNHPGEEMVPAERLRRKESQ